MRKTKSKERDLAKEVIADYKKANGGKLRDGSKRTKASFCAMRFIPQSDEMIKLWLKSASEYVLANEI